jgi:hypothetical protein
MSLCAEKLPADWFSGMTSLQTFMCTNCNWAEAADPAMAAWQALSWLDISGNPLQLGAVRADSSPANMLPPEWAQLNLMALKVRVWWGAHAAAPSCAECSKQGCGCMASGTRALEHASRKRPLCWRCRRCQVRDCNLAEWNSSLLAVWELQPAQGLLRTLRILDISNNPSLYFIDMEAFFGQMQLWEL